MQWNKARVDARILHFRDSVARRQLQERLVDYGKEARTAKSEWENERNKRAAVKNEYSFDGRRRISTCEARNQDVTFAGSTLKDTEEEGQTTRTNSTEDNDGISDESKNDSGEHEAESIAGQGERKSPVQNNRPQSKWRSDIPTMHTSCRIPWTPNGEAQRVLPWETMVKEVARDTERRQEKSRENERKNLWSRAALLQKHKWQAVGASPGQE